MTNNIYFQGSKFKQFDVTTLCREGLADYLENYN